jgi:hypothetical protein
MIDVTSIINDPDFVRNFVIQRVTGSVDEDGDWIDDDPLPDPIPVSGIVLPAKLNDLLILPEGQRQLDNIAIYSLTELKLGDMHTSKPDIIIYDDNEVGAHYQLAHTRYYAQCLLWYGIATRFRNAA